MGRRDRDENGHVGGDENEMGHRDRYVDLVLGMDMWVVMSMRGRE